MHPHTPRLTLALIAAALLWAPVARAQPSTAPNPPSAAPPVSAPAAPAADAAPAKVLYATADVLQVQTDTGPDRRVTQTVRLRLTDDASPLGLAGKDLTVQVPVDGPGGLRVQPGDRVNLRVQQDGAGTVTASVLEQTHRGIWLIFVLGALLLLLVGRRSGFLTLVTMTLVVLLTLFVTAPLILRGSSPVLAALVTFALFSALASLIIFRWTRAALAALISASASMLVCLLLGWALLAIASIGDYRNLTVDALRGLPGVHPATLPLAVAVLVTCGAVMHVVARVTSSVFLERQQHPDRGLTVLLDVGLTHGRRVLPAIAETALWVLLGMGLPELLLDASQVSVFRILQRGDIDLMLLLPLVLMGTVACAIPITTVTAAVLADRDHRA